MHAGRRYYASLQLEAGTSLRALAEYLGHTDPGFTLRTYTHVMPQAQDKAKRAVDDAFERLATAANDPLCGPDVARMSLLIALYAGQQLRALRARRGSRR